MREMHSVTTDLISYLVSCAGFFPFYKHDLMVNLNIYSYFSKNLLKSLYAWHSRYSYQY